MTPASSDIGEQLNEISRQVGALAEQVELLAERTAYLTEQARRTAVRQQEWDELKEDLTPIAGDVYALSVEHLSEVESYVQLDDMLRLSKRLARNTRNFENMLDQVESLHDLIEDATPLTHSAFAKTVTRLDEMERMGYFGFARESIGIMDRIVEGFTEEDVRLLGENIVTILNTVKALTQPEMMHLMSEIAASYSEVQDPQEELDISYVGLLKQMRNPQVRLGLAMTMHVLQGIGRASAAGHEGLVSPKSAQAAEPDPPDASVAADDDRLAPDEHDAADSVLRQTRADDVED